MARILFVDDDQVEQLFAREVLAVHGHEMVCARDGEEALEVYLTEGMYIDAVVTDLAMPRLNGLRLIEALREIDPTVLILAASGRNADQLDLAENAGVSAVFYKPWDPARFLATLEQLLESEAEEARAIPDWSFRKASA
ncbi:response regulator [Gaopeijia maritima]|uniref:response regulator n=1 Tax=Gaopeijia maritima TaxID=3119007 RepID=UPI0032507741